MSRNLLKGIYTTVWQEEKRVIDTNELVARRMEELTVKMNQTKTDGFVSGLNAPEITGEVSGAEDDGFGEAHSNVIKAGEDAESIRMQAEADAESILKEAEAEAERLKAEAKASADRERENVLAQARQQGYEEGMEKAEKEAEESRRKLKEQEKMLEAEYRKYVDELEPRFVETITGIYEHIFHVDLQSYREVLVYLISTAMHKAEGSRSFMVHVSKEDYPYVSMEKKQIMASTSTANSIVEIVEDATLGRNECMIETDNGIFDCGLGTQLSELAQKLKLLSYEREKR